MRVDAASGTAIDVDLLHDLGVYDALWPQFTAGTATTEWLINSTPGMSGERTHGGRQFTDLDEAGIAAPVSEIPELRLVETWVTGDRRPGRVERAARGRSGAAVGSLGPCGRGGH